MLHVTRHTSHVTRHLQPEQHALGQADKGGGGGGGGLVAGGLEPEGKVSQFSRERQVLQFCRERQV